MPGVLHHQMPRLESCGTPVDGYFFMHVANTTTSSEAPQRIFENYVHADGNSILCISNFSRRDTYFHSGHRLFWSDAMAECCVRAMRHSRGTMEGLETIWRLTISNEVTQGIIKSIFSHLPAGSTEADVEAGDDRFFALLASDHGKGPARMLPAFPELFGRRRMARIRVFAESTESQHPDLCWFLEPAPAPSPSPEPPPTPPTRPLSKREARKYKRMTSLTSLNSSALSGNSFGTS
ncbi:hypothetical protein QBC42DRAFT_169869 [Cladorrhinum samala]|uniref:Uncharacterized protein n=1 Tax=Cladorrhinum samala TaxID=585594 RepID=A0AAV9I1H3_9PEZI|nr:hypothetical protein QBC42DRAFT_169869 [Cladorrhinum samala]